MKIGTKVGISIVALLLLLGVSLTMVDRRIAGGFETGEPFPDLVFPSLEDGRPLSIANFRGEKVILHLFASW